MKWELVVTVDTIKRNQASPEPPQDFLPISFPLKSASHLIGRRSKLRDVYPEVSLNFDSAVSFRHALLERQSSGAFVLRDLGSSNGTFFHGKEIPSFTDIPLQDGDEFTLGHWTRIKIKLLE